MKGRCEHYAEIEVKTSSPKGTILPVIVNCVEEGRTLGIPALQIL